MFGKHPDVTPVAEEPPPEEGVRARASRKRTKKVAIVGPCCFPSTEEGQCPTWQLIRILRPTSVSSLCVPPHVWYTCVGGESISEMEKLVPLPMGRSELVIVRSKSSMKL